MRIAVIGGGPGGLYFAALARQLGPEHEITVWERNAPDDTFGFGVVFSDETLGGIEHADPVVHRAMQAEFARWDDIDVYYRGEGWTSGGHGFAAMSRRRLLEILQDRCRRLGVTMHFRTVAPDPDELCAGHDLVVAADGLNSAVRAKYADAFRPDLETRSCRYIWLGTDRVFEAFTFVVRETPYGVMQIHAYPYDAGGSTFIVEMHDDVWRAAGFDRHAARDFAPGESDTASIALLREIFADVLGHHAVHANNSRWISFATVRNETWRHRNVVLLGDAAHTAHFSIGSGTKLAMEDALALAACLHEQPPGGPGGPGAASDAVAAGLAVYEEERRPVVLSTQRAAQASLEWFENLGQYTHQEPPQFAFNILTRSRRITYDNLRLRDPEFVETVDRWFAATAPAATAPAATAPAVAAPAATAPAATAPAATAPAVAAPAVNARTRHAVEGRVASTSSAPAGTPARPMFQPFRLRDLELANRVVVSPMDMYSSVDGTPGDFHLVHLGGRALGGAALVMTEMVCVSAPGRITPGCAGLYAPDHEAAWRRIVDFVHAHSPAAIGVQLGHSGRKGSTRLMWEGIDEPLPAGNWDVCGPSPLPYSAASQVPRELSAAELAAIREEFVAAARRAARCGFDLLELHCAHGYLLSSFLSPLANCRTDAYGGSPANRLRYPLEVFDAVRAVWPAERPMSVRISATDWAAGGIGPEDAVRIAAAFAAHGADAVDVSTGQVVADERPAFGRSYQTPFADRIRNEVGVATIAVGVISSYDDVNSILLAGRADLVALGRAHLYDPAWTLHAAAEQDYAGPAVTWPLPYAAGSRRPQAGRTDGPKPRLQLIREGAPRTRHARWRP